MVTRSRPALTTFLQKRQAGAMPPTEGPNVRWPKTLPQHIVRYSGASRITPATLSFSMFLPKGRQGQRDRRYCWKQPRAWNAGCLEIRRAMPRGETNCVRTNDKLAERGLMRLSTGVRCRDVTANSTADEVQTARDLSNSPGSHREGP